MAVTVKKVLSREAFESLEIWDPSANTGAGGFVQIAGIETLTLSFDADEADTTDWDSAGWSEHLIGERSESVEIAGHVVYDDAQAVPPVRDAGQQLVESLARKTGIDSLQEIQLNTLGGGTIVWAASAQLGNQGGARSANASWGATFNSSGEPTVTAAA